MVNNPDVIVQQAEAVVRFICNTDDSKSEELENKMNKIVNCGYGGKPFKHDVLGILTMEKLLESILNFKIMDEKDYEKASKQKDVENEDAYELNSIGASAVSLTDDHKHSWTSEQIQEKSCNYSQIS